MWWILRPPWYYAISYSNNTSRSSHLPSKPMRWTGTLHQLVPAPIQRLKGPLRPQPLKVLYQRKSNSNHTRPTDSLGAEYKLDVNCNSDVTLASTSGTSDTTLDYSRLIQVELQLTYNLGQPPGTHGTPQQTREYA